MGFYEDVRPLKGYAGEVDWIFGGRISRLLIVGKIRGTLGETILLATQRKLPVPKVMLVGLGRKAEFDRPAILRVSEALSPSLYRLKVRDCAVELWDTGRMDPMTVAETMMEGLQKGYPAGDLDVTLILRREETARRLERVLRSESGVLRPSI
jgi:hypothetical protein